MTRRIAWLCAAALVLLPLSSCFSDRTSVVAPTGDDCSVPADAIGSGQAIVFIRDFSFFPDTLRIPAGTRVTWVNCESAAVEPHTSTASAGTWNSGPIPPGDSFAQTYSDTGTFGYFCTPHPSMIGAIIVQ
jgi:plastocyanin